MELETILKSMEKNAVELCFGEGAAAPGKSRFGGRPDLPADFSWPTFYTATYDDSEKKARPLSFLLQIDCKEAAPYDRDGLLPKDGTLYFFYELASMRWGYDPGDQGCARVCYVKEGVPLEQTPFPEELEEDYKLPEMPVSFQKRRDFPSWEELSARTGMREGWEEYDDIRERLGFPQQDNSSKLLGYADTIQGNMQEECELVSRGHYLGSGWPKMNEKRRQELAAAAAEWVLLFQLDTVTQGDFELMFGDCGRIYFYIRRRDLAAGKFDQVWLILQCC